VFFFNYISIILFKKVKTADKTRFGEADMIGTLVSTEDLKELKVRQFFLSISLTFYEQLFG
jgi:hypothetical protein